MNIIKCVWLLKKKKSCHAGYGSMPKPKFRQARHASRGLPNWTKWYSITTLHIVRPPPFTLSRVGPGRGHFFWPLDIYSAFALCFPPLPLAAQQHPWCHSIFFLYCTILFNSSVTCHSPSKINEMSRLSQPFWWSDETIFWQQKKIFGNGYWLILKKKKNTTLRKFCMCHAHLSHLTKQYFCQVHHVSQWLTNWIKWYSIPASKQVQEHHKQLITNELEEII